MVKKIIKKILLVLVIFFLILFGYFFIGKPPQAKEINWGVIFSQKHSRDLGLDWKENYLALLDDLNVKYLKIAVHWDLIEPENGEYNFEDLDWQIREAEKRTAEIILVIGMRTPRWPECHIPDWAKNLVQEDKSSSPPSLSRRESSVTKEKQQKEILELLENIVLRYRDSSAIKMWQVENEPFFPFGECPWRDDEFLEKEVKLVKSLDFLKRPVIISDTGEWSIWFRAAKIGDIVGTTMYRKVWFKEIKAYISLPFPPTYYWRRAQIIKRLFNKEVICVELQAEPWGPRLLYDLSVKEQQKTMNLEQFRHNIEFAKRTGLKEFFLWGAEWWFWLKVKQNNPNIWEEAKKLFTPQETL